MSEVSIDWVVKKGERILVIGNAHVLEGFKEKAIPKGSQVSEVYSDIDLLIFNIFPHDRSKKTFYMFNCEDLTIISPDKHVNAEKSSIIKKIGRLLDKKIIDRIFEAKWTHTRTRCISSSDDVDHDTSGDEVKKMFTYP